jgi:preprotein translocase subunit Sec61beta
MKTPSSLYSLWLGKIKVWNKVSLISGNLAYHSCNTKVSALSQKSKKRESAPMPSASAGLLRFFEEETKGIKVRPELVVALAAALIMAVILAKIFLPI